MGSVASREKGIVGVALETKVVALDDGSFADIPEGGCFSPSLRPRTQERNTARASFDLPQEMSLKVTSHFLYSQSRGEQGTLSARNLCDHPLGEAPVNCSELPSLTRGGAHVSTVCRACSRSSLRV